MSYSSQGIPKSANTRREERTVTFVFRQSATQHCAGINSVAVSHDGTSLWTASRDSLIKRWDVSNAQQSTLKADFEGHVDWVNAITLLGEQQKTLISCSSDRTLRVWTAWGEGPTSSVACLSGHSDYVTSLAAATLRPCVVSGGLRSEVFLWDVQKCSSNSSMPVKLTGVLGSVYSLAMDDSGSTVAAGTADGCIWLLDTRTGRAEAQLRGHNGNVRALLMRPDGFTLTSGSADRTIRSWDLRQRRGLATLAVHADSVWALAAAEPNPQSADATHSSKILSGGRDGYVYRTDLTTRHSEVVVDAHRDAPVTALALHSAPGSNILWVATTSSTIRAWYVSASAGPSTGAFVAGSLPAMRSRTAFEGTSTAPPVHPESRSGPVITGAPSVREVAVLTDRRHVLARDDEGRIRMWDLSLGAPLRDLGIRSMRDVERDLFDPAQNVSPWFSPDARLGCLAGVMTSPACFGAEAYKRDLGDLDAAPDAKINMGEHMLRALFDVWALRRGRTVSGVEPRRSKKSDAKGPADTPTQRAEAFSSSRDGESGSEIPSNVAMMDATGTSEAEKSPEHVDENAQAEIRPSPARRKKFSFSLKGEMAPVVFIAGDGEVPPWRCSVDAFDGSEPEGTMVPRWVADCVLRGTYPVGKDLKMAFTLVPAPGSNLPSLLQSKLNAPRVLGIDKVADFVLRKMAEQGVTLIEEPLFWAPEKQTLWEQERGKTPSDSDSMEGQERQQTHAKASGGLITAGFVGIRQLRPLIGGASSVGGQEGSRPLLITCDGAAVPWDFTLAAVKQWMWKRPEDLRLEYGIRQVGTELRPPVIRPPH